MKNMKGDKPLKVAREQNINVTMWENEKKSKDGTYKTISVDVSRPTTETKDKPREEREYVHARINIQHKQLDVLIKLLNQMKEE